MPRQNNQNPYQNMGATSADESRGFEGVDMYHDSQDLSGSYLLEADNVVNVSGRLFVRPGLLGLFGGTPPSSSSSSSSMSGFSSSSSGWYDVGNTYYSVPSGGASYGLDYLIDGSGNAWIIFVNGGKLYKTLEGAGSYTELLDVNKASYAFNGPLTDSAKVGPYLYLADGAHPTTRVTLAGGFPAYEMFAPGAVPPANNATISPSSQLTNTLLWQANNAANWSFDGQATPYTNLLQSYGIFGLAPETWTALGIQGPGLPSGTNYGWVNMIAAAATVYPGSTTPGGDFIAVPHLTGNTSLYPSRFHVLMYVQKDGSFHGQGNTYAVNFTVTPYNSIQVQIGAAITMNASPAQGTSQLFDWIFDFSGLGPNVAYVKIQLTNGGNSNSGNIWASTPSFVPISVQTLIQSGPAYTSFIPSISGGGIATSSSSSSAIGSSSSANSAIILQTPTDLGETLDYAGTSFIFSFPPASSSSSSSSLSGQSSSSSGTPERGVSLVNINRLTIVLGPTGVLSSWTNLGFSLSLQQDTGGGTSQWILADGGVSVSSDGTALFCDISTLAASSLTNIIGLKLTFLANVAWISPYYAMQLGPISTPGNLSIGDANYFWYYTETAIIDAFNQVESNPSLASGFLIPSQTQAEGLIGLPQLTPQNAPTNQYNFYRGGGVDSYPILVASVSRYVSVAYGTDPTNPYYSWNAVTGVFQDNTPDLFLASAPLLSFSKDPMPSNAQSLGVWQGRLCVAVGTQLYISWLYNSDNSAPLMTTYVQNTDDPNQGIAGANFPISTDSSDTTVRLVPFGTPVAAGNQFGGVLVAFCKRSLWFIQGQDATSFAPTRYPYAEGVGLVAFHGVATISASQMVFMGPDRLHVLPPQGYEYYTTGVEADNPQQDIGVLIKPALYPSPPDTPLQNSVAFAQSSITWHSSRIYLCCPVPGGLSNSVVWIYDFLVPGWVRWTGPAPLCSSSSSSSSSSNSSSSSGAVQPSAVPMAFTNALSLPPIPGTTGAAYALYFFGLNGQVYDNVGPVDQATPLSSQNSIPFAVTVHAMRPGFFVRYKKRPLYYMRARLEWFEVDMVMTGTLIMESQAYTAGIAAPVPIPGATDIQSYGLASLGSPFTVYVPPGLILGTMVTVRLSGAVNQPAYLRGLRGWVSSADYEHS